MTRPVTAAARAADLLDAVDCACRDTRFYDASDADRLAVALRYAVEALDKVLRTYPSSAEWVESSAHLIADALREPK